MARPATAAVRLMTGEREPVRLATTGDISLYGLQTIDGVLTNVGDRVLVKDQADATRNGIYTASSGQWYRAADARASRTMQKGTTVHVQAGSTNAGKTFVFSTLDPVVGDTDISIGFYQSDDQIGIINAAVAAGLEALADASNFILDEDDMVSDSNTKVPTQQSVKAYVTAGFSTLKGGVSAAFDTLVEIATDLGRKMVKSANLSDVASVPTARNNLVVPTYVTTRAALKALDTTKDTVAILDGSLWFWTAGNFSTQVTADAAEGVYVKATAIVSSSGAWVRSFTGTVYPEWFGALGDGTTDDAAALQSAINFALQYGIILQLGAKNYRANTTLTASTTSVASNNRLTIRGCGHYKTIIRAPHNGTVLRIGSATNAAFSGYVLLEDFGIENYLALTPAKGIEMFDVVRSTVNRVRTAACTAGVYLNGGVSLIFNDCQFEWCVEGFVATNFTSLAGGGLPNFITLQNCKVINNFTRGINFGSGAFLILDGCDIEGNGTAGQVGHCGLQVRADVGALATMPYAFGVTVRNCWFEANNGAASIALLGGTNTIKDCYFVANSGSTYDIYIGAGSYRVDGTQHDSIMTAHIIDVGTTTSNNFINNARQRDGSRASIQVTPARAYMPDLGVPVSTQERVLLADFTGTNVAIAQPVFSSPTSLTLDAATTYEFEAEYFITRAVGTTSHTTGVLFGGTATFNAFRYLAEVINPTGNVLTNVQAIRSDAASLVTLTAANTSSTENLIIRLKGRLRTNAAGTLIPQFQFSAAPGGAPTVLANSAIRVWAVGNNQVAAVGPWS